MERPEDAITTLHTIGKLKATPNLGHMFKHEASRLYDYIDHLEARTQWQPIDTAPRDRTPILVHFKDKGPVMVRWNDPWGPRLENGIWCVDDDKNGPYPLRGYSDGDDTHWMPLPPPPAVAQVEEGHE